MSLILELTENDGGNISQDIEESSPERVQTAEVSANSERYLLCIISCEKNRERKDILKEKWIDNLIQNNDKIDVIFIYGKNDLEENYLEVGDELHVKCDDSYERLVDKMDKFWDFILEKKSDYFKIIKCDDDNYIRTEKFSELLEDSKDIPIFGKSCDNENFKNMNSLSLERDSWRGGFKVGWLYIVSQDVIREFVHKRNDEYKGLHEDKRFYDFIREKYPFIENKELEEKYLFYAIPIYRRPRNIRKINNTIYNNVLKSTLISNLNTDKLKNKF
tara:strand:+ start:6801 stop:7625 length:825 start_codon:yes stop_codon:yes gene_type:complete